MGFLLYSLRTSHRAWHRPRLWQVEWFCISVYSDNGMYLGIEYGQNLVHSLETHSISIMVRMD